MNDFSKIRDEVNWTLQARLDWVQYNGATYAGPDGDMRLQTGDTIINNGRGVDGWTRREVENARRPYLENEDKFQFATYMTKYWFYEWNGLPNLAKAARDIQVKDREDRRKARQARDWVSFGPPGKYGRLLPDSFRTDTEEQRSALEKMSIFPWSSEAEDATELSTLLLLGTPGTGKTHLAALWLREKLFGEGYQVQFITAAQLVREVRRAWDERGVDETEVLSRFGSIGCLVIDDIGVDATEGAVRMLVEVLDMRLANEVPTCVTSNATPKQLKEIFGPRGFSRLMANAQTVTLTGADQRRAGSGATLHVLAAAQAHKVAA